MHSKDSLDKFILNAHVFLTGAFQQQSDTVIHCDTVLHNVDLAGMLECCLAFFTSEPECRAVTLYSYFKVSTFFSFFKSSLFKTSYRNNTTP